MSSQIYPTLPGLSIEITRSYVWKTFVQEALSGKQSTLSLRQYPLVSYELTYTVLRDVGAAGYGSTTSEIAELVDLYNQMQGRWDTFLFTDPDFNTIPNTALSVFAHGNGTVGPFQLTAFYGNNAGLGGAGAAEIVQNLNGSPQIYVNGVGQSTPTNYSIGATGLVTFTSGSIPASGAAIEWNGSFYYRCRFDEDAIVWKRFMNKLWSATVKFTSVKLVLALFMIGPFTGAMLR